jgi:hypothetical protein
MATSQKPTREELLKGLHRGRNNHLDNDIVETLAAVKKQKTPRGRLKVSMTRLIARVEASIADLPAKQRAPLEELVDDFKQNLDAWIKMNVG